MRFLPGSVKLLLPPEGSLSQDAVWGIQHTSRLSPFSAVVNTFSDSKKIYIYKEKEIIRESRRERSLVSERLLAALFTRPKAIEPLSVLLFSATIKNQFNSVTSKFTRICFFSPLSLLKAINSIISVSFSVRKII